MHRTSQHPLSLEAGARRVHTGLGATWELRGRTLATLVCYQARRAPFLSRTWMTDEHIDIIIATLDIEIRQIPRPKSHNIQFIDTILARSLIKAYTEDNNGTMPFLAQGTSPLHRFGSNMTATTEIAGIFHVRGNHWVAFAVNTASKTISSGDPASQTPDPLIVASLKWLMRRFLGILEESVTVNTMLTPIQNLAQDSWNCAIFSEQALSTYFNPCGETFSPSNGDLARLSMLRRIIICIEKVCCLAILRLSQLTHLSG